jgi:hypothetical protein
MGEKPTLDALDVIMGIAMFHFHVSTLETRNDDSLDFHEVGIWSIRAALIEAYETGRRAAAEAAA